MKITKRRKVLLAIGGLVILVVLYKRFYEQPYKEEELSVNGLVYLKKTGELFSGTMRTGDKQHWGEFSYCKGEPCGHYLCVDYGDVTAECNYLDKAILPPEVQKIIGKRSFAISLGGEGEISPHNPDSCLTINILEPEWGTFEFKNYQHIDEIASSAAKATSQLKYKYLEIWFVSDFSWNYHYWYEVRYLMNNGIPVLDRRDSIQQIVAN